MQKQDEQMTAVAGEGGETVNELLTGLRSHDWRVREHARLGLETLGGLALFPLTDALNDPDWHVRWEATKALQDIGDPRGAPALIGTLTDSRFGVRWLASEALIVLKEAALGPLLDALVHHGDSLWLRLGAHRVLGHLTRGLVSPEVGEILQPVLTTLEGTEPSLAAPVAAGAALDELQRRGFVGRVH